MVAQIIIHYCMRIQVKKQWIMGTHRCASISVDVEDSYDSTWCRTDRLVYHQGQLLLIRQLKYVNRQIKRNTQFVGFKSNLQVENY